MKKFIIIFLSLIIMLNIGCLNRSTLCGSERIQNKIKNDSLGDIEKNNRLKDGHSNTNTVYSSNVIECLEHDLYCLMIDLETIRSNVDEWIERGIKTADRSMDEERQRSLNRKTYYAEYQRSLNRKIYDEYTAIYSRLLKVDKLLKESSIQLERKYYSEVPGGSL